MENKVLSIWPIVILLVLTYIVGALTMGYINRPAEVPAVPTASEIASKIVIPTVTVAVPTIDNATVAKIDAIKTQVTKDQVWEDQAKVLATDEWNHNGYRDLFDALVANNISIVEKGDISSVVIREETVSGLDTDNKDANVYQELKVYYEDSTGEKLKAYINVDTEVRDNDVNDQTFELA